MRINGPHRELFFFLLLIAAAVAVLPRAAGAQDFSGCTTNTQSGPNCPDAGSAQSNAQRVAQLYATDQTNQCNSFGHPNCDRFQPKRLPDSTWVSAPYTGWIQVNYTVCSTVGCTATAGTFNRKYPPEQPNLCQDRAGETATGWGSSFVWPVQSPRCNSEGCQVTEAISSAPIVSTEYRNGEPVTVYSYFGTATFTGQECSDTGEDGDLPGEDEGDEIGDGWKCDVQTGLCTDPDGNGRLCTFNPDGTRSACVPYKPGDGTDPAPDEPEEPDDPRDEGNVTGGANCNAAPACSGKDKVACAQLWQQWKTRCEAADARGKINGSNATCSQGLSSGYACVGDAVTCRTLNDTHAIRCAIGEIQSGGVAIQGGDEGDGDDPFGKAEERAAIDGADAGVPEGEGLAGVEAGDAWAPTDGDVPEVDTGFFGAGGGCPTMPTVSFGPVTWTAPSELCDVLAIVRLLILTAMFIWAAGMITRGS